MPTPEGSRLQKTEKFATLSLNMTPKGHPMPPCPHCGAPVPDGGQCRDSFDLLLSWEWEHDLMQEHHLLVVCYHLQHPYLYSREGLAGALDVLRRWVIEGEYVFAVREDIRARVASDRRKTPITARPDNEGAYAHPVRWAMTAADVVANGHERYYASVRAWAASVVEALREAGVLRG